MIFILLPAYNEELSLPPLLEKVRLAMEQIKASYRIVICDDGSRDGTLAVAKRYRDQLPIEILRHKINRGLGETIRDLIEFAVEHSSPEDVIVRMDCDDTHEPETIGRMAARLGEDCDVVLASRFQEGGGQQGVSRYRGFISAGANLFMRAVFPIRGVNEYSCGFRAYRAEILHRAVAHYGNNFIQLKGLGFTCTLEKLLKLHLLGARFGEQAFVLQYGQKVSESKMVTSITTMGYLVMTICYYWPWGGWYKARLARHTREPEAN